MRDTGRGFSLVELMTAIAIIGVLLTLGASNFSMWISNMKVRSTAEAIQAGLQLARGEAVRRNDRIHFSLTDSVVNGCNVVTDASNWVVSFDQLANDCGGARFNEAFPVSHASNPAPRIIQVRTAAEGSAKVVVAADQGEFVFNGLGRLATVPGTNPVVIDFTNPTAGTCAAVGGKVRCLRVTVTAGGQVRMCDPAYATGGTDPQRC